MKSFKILFTFAFVLCFGMSYAQITVATSNNACVGCTDPGTARLKSQGAGQLEFAISATQGNTDFTYQTNGITKGQIKYLNGNPGITYNLDANGTGTTGVPDSRTALYLSASDLQVGVNTTNPNATLDVNGNINYSGNLTNASDKRLKKNIDDFKLGLEAVLEIRPVSYSYNGKAGLKADGYHVGMLAQNLQEVAPSLVSTWNYIEYAEQTQEELDAELPSKKIASEDYLSVNEGAIKYMLINAIREQQQIINTLQNRIEVLESTVNK